MAYIYYMIHLYMIISSSRFHLHSRIQKFTSDSCKRWLSLLFLKRGFFGCSLWKALDLCRTCFLSVVGSRRIECWLGNLRNFE